MSTSTSWWTREHYFRTSRWLTPTPSYAQRRIQSQLGSLMHATGHVDGCSCDGPWHQRQPAAPLGARSRDGRYGCAPAAACGLPGSNEDVCSSLHADAVARRGRSARHPHRTAPWRHRDQCELACRGRRHVRGLDARAAAMIRIDAMWLLSHPNSRIEELLPHRWTPAA